MHRRFLEFLACPACGEDAPLSADGDAKDDDAKDGEIVTGALSCERCGAAYPVRDGVPRFTGEDSGDYDNFAFQWRQWRTVQIDRLGGHDLSERRFLADTRWTPEWLRGRLILDAGCGAGRFADIAALHGATVIACDISDAIDAAAETLGVHGERVACLQASIYDLPLRRGAFDGVYCMGVIQHTPDPARTMKALPPFLKPGGRLVYNFYERGLSPRLQVVKYALRLITPHLPRRVTLALSKALVGVFFPLTRLLSRVRYVRFANHFMPIAATHPAGLTREQQYRLTLLETFDWYGPRHELRQDHREVMALLEGAGLVDVDGAPGLAWARRPD